MEEKKLALLIDGDNISSKYIKTIIDESTAYGVVTYKRIYGDWTKPNLDSWKKELLEYSINPMQQYAYTSGKNATDSAMIIDAMDILYTKTVDGFILVSSDSDFTRLAARLKESGMIVIGMGKTQTPKPFVSACSQFKFLDVLSEENDEIDKQEDAKKTTKLSSISQSFYGTYRSKDKTIVLSADGCFIDGSKVENVAVYEDSGDIATSGKYTFIVLDDFILEVYISRWGTSFSSNNVQYYLSYEGDTTNTTML